MEHQTIEAGFLQTICWKQNTIVDFSSGWSYGLNGTKVQHHSYFGFGDSAIISNNGEYAFIFQKLGTKGLLLKNGELLREINRSYYFSTTYEYPAAFVEVAGKTCLVHCPIAYNQIDFEDVETGELLTNIDDREPEDFFHSRFEISPEGTYLISKGWVWHPLDRIMVYDIKECIGNPKKLDNPQMQPDTDSSEICTGSFINDTALLIGSSDEFDDEVGWLPPKHICVWDLKTNSFSTPVYVKEDFGNLFAIDDTYAWDLLGFPKMINVKTGEIVDSNEAIDSGKQKSLIINIADEYPAIIYNRETKQIAIKKNEKIEVLTPGRLT